MKSFGGYAAISIVLVALAGWGLSFAFHGAGDADAIAVSAVVAVVVQVAAFGVTRLLAPSNLMAGWGAGSVVRLLALFVYALLAVKVLGLAPAAALVSLAAFFFLATLIEPLFLRP